MNDFSPHTASFPTYRSLKHVKAVKVVLCGDPLGDDGKAQDVNLAPIEEFENLPGFSVDSFWVAKRIDLKKFRKGDHGYYVVYADGYTSWSPVEAFEAGHQGPIPQTRYDNEAVPGKVLPIPDIFVERGGRRDRALKGGEISHQPAPPLTVSRDWVGDYRLVVSTGPHVLLESRTGVLWEWRPGQGLKVVTILPSNPID